jgi:glycosyltransferase involved in cell wall biosynthesis
MVFTNVSNVVREMDGMRKKVMFILPTLNKGGSERVSSIIANNLDKTKFDVVFVTTNVGNDDFILNNDIKYIRLNKTKTYFAFFALLKVLFSEKPNIIFTCTQNTALLSSLCTTFYKKKVKYVLRESTMPSVCSKYLTRPAWINQIFASTYPKFDLIICQGQNIKKDLVDNYKIAEEKLIIINNPLEFEKIEEEKIEEISDFTKTGDAKILITVANLTSHKGHARILQALKYIDTNFQYLIIGNGAQYEKLKSLAEQLGLLSKIKFLGNKANPFPYLYQSDLFLQGSLFEGFPNALLEANVLGVPSVVFNCPGGTDEIVEDYVTGMKVPNDAQPETFAEALKTAMNHDFNKENIIALTKEKYNLNKIIRQYEVLFDKLINS